VFLGSKSAAVNLSSCDCPPRCTNVLHEATFSSLLLSNYSYDPSYDNPANNFSAISRRYINAAQTRTRVATQLLRDIIGHLEKLARTCQRLKSTLAVDLVEHTTSVPGHILASVNLIVQKTTDSLVQFKLQIADEFIGYYDTNVDYFVTQSITFAMSLTSYYNKHKDLNDSDSFDETFVDSIRAFCEVYAANLTANTANFSTKLVTERGCDDTITTLSDHFCRYTPPTESVAHIIRRLKDQGVDVPVKAKELLHCLLVYRTFLDELQSWMKTKLTMNSSLPLQPANRRYVLKGLGNDIKWMTSVSREFAENSMVKSSIVTNTSTNTNSDL